MDYKSWTIAYYIYAFSIKYYNEIFYACLLESGTHKRSLIDILARSWAIAIANMNIILFHFTTPQKQTPTRKT